MYYLPVHAKFCLCAVLSTYLKSCCSLNIAIDSTCLQAKSIFIKLDKLTLHSWFKSWQWKLRNWSGPITWWWGVVSLAVFISDLSWDAATTFWDHGLLFSSLGPVSWAWWRKGCRVINVGVMIVARVSTRGYGSSVTWRKECSVNACLRKC